MRKRRVVGRVYGMKYSWKGHNDGNRHKNRIKRIGQARLVYVKDINRNVPTTWSWARGDVSILRRFRLKWTSITSTVVIVRCHCTVKHNLVFLFVFCFCFFVLFLLLPVITYSLGDLHPDALAPFLAKGSSDPSRLQHQRLHCIQGGWLTDSAQSATCRGRSLRLAEPRL